MTWTENIIEFLALPPAIRADIESAVASVDPSKLTPCVILPFEPRSCRDFMFYERHLHDAARGFVRKFWPRYMPLVHLYEIISSKPFPAFRPKKLWHREPIYYMGNHLAFITDDDQIVQPPYTAALDYELELGFVLARGLYNACPDEAEAAIGGFVVFNDISARDLQFLEMQSGFGPQKSKHFCNAISSTLVTADEILPIWQSLQGFVKINDQLVSQPTSGGARWSLGDALSHASRSERLLPGEFFGTGTFPGGSGIEIGRLLEVGDVVEIGIEGIGYIRNHVVR
ncbi:MULTISPECIES: fumarylacetoacetate hydrolase family protein [unclassified Phyllobacterium]|uniref:fumarylacetoacetate hydrolase family protein n=1 Tax=unclassified Phyllobacterium TaxID=2638441 RepID=UPI003012F4F4